MARVSSKRLLTDYEPKRRNPITLGDDSFLDSHLKPIKIDSKNSILELSDSKLRVSGDIESSNMFTSDTGDLTLYPDGDLIISGADVKIDATKKIYLDGGTHTSIDEESDDRMRFTVGTDEMLILDEASDAITMAATNWIAATVSGATITEFSAANSAYAGMILGFTVDGNDSADQTYNLTTSYVVFDSDLAVTFKTPPSEKVEIQATFYYQQGSSGVNVLASIANNSTYGSSDLHNEVQHERSVTAGAERGGQGIVTVSWYLIDAGLEAVGASNTIYFAAACSATTGTPNIKWGGDATGEYQNFVMKAIALPA